MTSIRDRIETRWHTDDTRPAMASGGSVYVVLEDALRAEWTVGNLIPKDEVDARIEAAVAEARALPAALDVVIEAVEAHERSGKWAWKIDDDGKVIWASQFIQLLRALRAADTAPETQDE